MVQNQDSLIKWVGIAAFTALAYVFIAPKLFKTQPFDISGIGMPAPAAPVAEDSGDLEDEYVSSATFTDDVIPGVYDYGVRLATTGV